MSTEQLSGIACINVTNAGTVETGETKIVNIAYWSPAASDVNETLKPETEPRPKLLAFSTRRDQDKDL